MRSLLLLTLSTLPLLAQDPAPAGGTPPAPVKTGATPGASGQKPVEPKPAAQKPVSDTPQGKPKPADGTTGDGKPVPVKGDGKTDPPKPDEGPGKIDRPPADQPMPKGTDPADLAAIRGAQAMIEAEKKLSELIKAGKITGLDKILTFDELTSWPYEDGLNGMPQRIKDLNGKKVLMTGFMLPIDEVQNIKEFLLVQSLWSCCFGQPPDINGIVRVVMPKGKTTDYFFDPLKIIGTFKVEATVMDGYCVDIYQLHVESLEAIK